MTATCKHCGANSEQVEFYKGVNSRCKECHKEQVRLNRAERFEQYQEYEKMRYKRDPQRAEMNRAWAKTDHGKASHAQSIATRNARSPEKRAANGLVAYAIKSGRIIKPLECSRCNRIPPRRQLHAHHDDYAKPLDVVWICVTCHGLEHHGDAPKPPEFNRPRGFNVQRKPV